MPLTFLWATCQPRVCCIRPWYVMWLLCLGFRRKPPGCSSIWRYNHILGSLCTGSSCDNCFFQISIVQLSWHWIPSIELCSWWSWWNWKPWDSSRTKCCFGLKCHTAMLDWFSCIHPTHPFLVSNPINKYFAFLQRQGQTPNFKASWHGQQL